MAIYSNNVSIANDGELIGGGVEWQSVKTASFTAVANEGYFVNTTSSAITVTLPASPSAGDTVVLKDYARTWGTNAVSIASALFDGVAGQTPSFSTNGQTVTLVYMDGTKGWSLINEDTTTGLGAQYISATGGTVTTSGDFKIHTFTGDGCFVVSSLGNPAGGSTTVDYLVVAGGGGGGRSGGAGGGGGGYRESKDSTLSSPHTASPLAATTGLTITTTTYPITVGGGGFGITGPTAPLIQAGSGSNSVFSTITSAGGSGGGSNPQCGAGLTGGGSGGGGRANQTNPVAAGNTPPVSPPQGNPGGSGGPANAGGGGGGAGGTGVNAGGRFGGCGGNGVATSITGSSVTRAGGGGGGTDQGTPTPGTPGTGGIAGPGGGGAGGVGCSPSGPTYGVDGTANTGGGGGGASNAPAYPDNPNATGGGGGKGIVIIRYKYQN